MRTKSRQVIEHPDKVYPHSLELEEAVLGAFISNEHVLIHIMPILKPEIFYNNSNSKICLALMEMYHDEQPIDLLTLSNKLQSKNQLEEVGGVLYISNLLTKVTTTSNVHYHFLILVQFYFRRELIYMGIYLSEKPFSLDVDVFDIYEWAKEKLENMDIYASTGSYQDISKTIDKLKTVITNIDNSKTFYPICDKGIDDILTISPSNILGISGKSGSGKTSYCIYLAKSLLTYYGNNVSFCWYTMEDEAEKILMSMISPEVKLTHSQMNNKNYKLNEHEIKLINSKLENYKSYDIEFIEKSSSMAQIKPKFQRFCATRPNKFCILIIDNIMTLSDNQSYRFKNNQNSVDDYIAGEIYRIFESTKSTYKINIWYMHHLTKEQLSMSNSKEGYRPREEHIRGSARLRDVATQSILVHRPGEHIDIVKHYRKTEYEEPIKYLMINEVFKNRNGNTGFMRYFCSLDYKIFYPF